MAKNGKDGKMAFEGGDASFHHEEAGGLYGTHEYEVKKQGSHAPDLRVTRSLGDASEPVDDETERWLRKNDPKYNSRGWNG